MPKRIGEILKEGRELEKRLKELREEAKDYSRATGVLIDLDNWKISPKNLFYEAK
jgi:hypothetical protein